MARQPRRSKRPTLREVADSAGVSTATVSLVVNGKARSAGITEETERVVAAAVAELQYTPNRMASAVVTGRSRMVGIVSALSRELFETRFGSRVLNGFARGARLKGYNFVLLEDVVSPGEEERADVLRRANEMCVEGLIVLVDIGRGGDTFEIDPHLSRVLPTVKVQFTFDPAGAPGFRVDHHAAARVAMAHFVERGHRRIGFCAANIDRRRSRATLRLVESGLEDHGIEFNQDLLFEVPGWDRIEDLVREIEQKKPTALFTLYDGEAVRMMGALTRAGVRIPEDISIIGYGDSPLSKDLSPPLTSFRPPMKEIGQAAIEHLIDCIESGESPELKESQDFVGELIERGSTGPVST